MPHKLFVLFTWSASEVVFVNSMSDTFHEEFGDDYIRLTIDVMASIPWHTYQVFTKRHESL